MIDQMDFMVWSHLLRASDLLVESSVVQGQPAVDGKCLERFLVNLGENAVALVDHLDNSDDAGKSKMIRMIDEWERLKRSRD
jgi:hypothetical protein